MLSSDQLNLAAKYLVDDLPGVDVPAGTFSGGAGSLIGWLMIAVAVAAVAVVALAELDQGAVPTAFTARD